ncbi:hypothetical protein VNO77_11230 [Canavalia gladiata]|uniref:Uncharacterized protein n=1 Tax=Canavalia gladiata TaxID=3824 RepID=A0AAN9MF30_CANGL
MVMVRKLPHFNGEEGAPKDYIWFHPSCSIRGTRCLKNLLYSSFSHTNLSSSLYWFLKLKQLFPGYQYLVTNQEKPKPVEIFKNQGSYNSVHIVISKPVERTLPRVSISGYRSGSNTAEQIKIYYCSREQEMIFIMQETI